MTRPASQKQMAFLKRLGYSGQLPATVREASAAIDAMLEKKDSKRAEKALLAERGRSEKARAKRRRKELATIGQEVNFMLQENRRYGSDGLYAGFMFVPLDGVELAAQETQYAGAFLPLQVAARFPDLLAMDTLDVEEVLTEDHLERGTRMVVAPGKFKPLGHRGLGCSPKFILVLGVMLLVLLAIYIIRNG